MGKMTFPVGLATQSKVKKKAALALLAEMLALVQGWAAAFRECDDPSRCWGHAMINLEQSLVQLGTSWKHVKEAQNPSMAYHPSDYAFGH